MDDDPFFNREMKERGMKTAVSVFVGLAMAVAGAHAAASGESAAWVGVWNGQLDGQPGVRLTVGNDTGELGGTVVFNVIRKENGQARVVGSSTHVLMHPKLEGNTLSFEVVRQSDLRELQMTVKLESEGKAKLQCLNCGEDAPVAEIVREQ
jgi:hypothetical protein